ncbi:MAG: ATP-binding protein [Myxococcota bacterium]|nr:ATP-binding protein [Myxococcota bacterium]
MISRVLADKLRSISKVFPVVTLTGPRQSGKTTLCRMVFSDLPLVSLEAPDIRAYAVEDPRSFLAGYRDGAVFDEVQRTPELLSYLLPYLDENPGFRGKFVLTGSANFALLSAVSQSLAGRSGLLTLLPCSWDELGEFPQPASSLDEAILQGAFPAVFDRGIQPWDWFSSYVGTYVERDVRRILNVSDLGTFQAFIRILAGRTGQLLNLAQVGAEVGISHTTTRSWVNVLEASYLVLRLPPLHANLGKRLTKSPKLYFLDTGLACYLLGIETAQQLRHHPLRGALFETWVVTEALKARFHKGLPAAATFYRDQNGAEVDLVIEASSELLAVEIKAGATVASDFFRGLETMRGAFEAVDEPRSWRGAIVYGGNGPLRRRNVEIVPWTDAPRLFAPQV